jgi:hypothetical protein
MIDPRFKTCNWLLCTGIVVVVEYDEKLLLPLLLEINKLLMHAKVKTTYNIHSQVDYEVLFHTTTTTIDTYTNIVSKELVGFQWFPIDA